MLFKKKFTLLAVFLIAALALAACGDKIEDSLNNTEKVVAKIEKLADKKDFTDADYKEYQKLMQELQTQGQKDAEAIKGATPTAKQTERGQDIAKRLVSASMKCEMNHQLKK